MFLATLVGNLGRDVELVTSKSGKSLIKLALGVSMGKDRPTQWVGVLANDNPNLAAYLLKGTQILVTGRVTISYERGYLNIDVFADQLSLLGNRQTERASGSAALGGAPAPLAGAQNPEPLAPSAAPSATPSEPW